METCQLLIDGQRVEMPPVLNQKYLRFGNLFGGNPVPCGDGYYVLGDDFEDGALDGNVWLSQTGGVTYVEEPVSAGAWALRLGGGSVAESAVFDTSACTDLLWLFDDKRGPAKYRTKISGVIFGRAARAALARAKG